MKKFIKENEIIISGVAVMVILVIIFMIAGDPAKEKKPVTPTNKPNQTNVAGKTNAPEQATPTPMPSIKTIEEANKDGSDKFVGTWMYEQDGQRYFVKIIKNTPTKYEIGTVVDGKTTGGAYGYLENGIISLKQDIGTVTIEIKEDGLLYCNYPGKPVFKYKKLSNEILNVM